MADKETEDLLHKLGLEALTDTFKKNGITQSRVQMLDRKMIEELITDIGPRAAFLEYWSKNIDTVKEPSKKKQKQCDSTQKSSKKSIQNYSFRSIDEILDEHADGRRILTYYETHEKLLNKHRNKLCHILLQEADDKKMKVDNDLAEYLADTIPKRFKGEVATTYYIPPVPKHLSPKNKSEPSSGKLISIRNNRATQESNFQKMLKKKEPNHSSFPQESSIAHASAQEVMPMDVAEALKWIKDKNQLPRTSLLTNWGLTTCIRVKELSSITSNDLSEFFDVWELYKQPDSSELLEIDFKVGNYSQVTLNFDNWMQFIALVREHAELSETDDTALKYLQILDSTDERVGEDEKVAVSLMVLSHFAPVLLTKKFSKKDLWKPSVNSAKETMIQNPLIAGNLTKIRKEVREQAAVRRERVQPYIIVVGKLHAITEVYVNIDDIIMYQVSSVLKAIDICFKAFFVFQLKYPYDSQHLWLMIQRGIYKITTEYDKILPAMSYLMSKIDEKNRPSQDSVNDKNNGDSVSSAKEDESVPQQNGNDVSQSESSGEDSDASS